MAFFTTIDNIDFLKKVYAKYGYRLKSIEKYNSHYPITKKVIVTLTK